MPSVPFVRLLRSYALTMLALVIAISVRWVAEPWLQGQVPFITLFGAVAVGVWIGGIGPAVTASCLGFLAVALLLDEGGNFDPGGSRFWLFLGGYAFSCALIVGFGERLRRARLDLSIEVEQRRRAEHAAHQSEQDFRHAVELHPQVSWTALPDGRLEHLSDRWREWTGITGLDDAWRRGLHPEDRARAIGAWTEATRTGQPFDVEHRVRRADGSDRWARSRARPRLDEAGRVVKWYGSTEDTHEARQAAAELSHLNATLEQQVAERTAALQASEARMRAVFSTSYQFQGLLAPDGTLLDANAMSLRGIGATLEEVVGRPFWDTPWFNATPGMPEMIREAVGVVAAGGSIEREIVVRLPSGERIVDFAMRPVREPDGTIIAIVPEGVDVTERHHAERQLRQAQKLQSVGHLTGGIAHDLNNLLQVIGANLQLVGRRTAGDAAIEQRLAVARQAIDRGARLAAQLLAFGRRQALQPKVVHVGQLLHGMADRLQRALGPAITLQIDVADPLWNTRVDPAQIELAMLNLAQNARDAIGERPGRLTVTVDNRRIDPSQPGATNAGSLQDGNVSGGDHVVIAVHDDGRGMPPDVLAQACEPFFSTKPADTGSGLGLSMVYGFVKQSGGHLALDSEVGAGTTVRLHLPRSTRRQDVLHDAVEGPLAGGSETVLVAEDDAGVRHAAAEMLGELGYRVVSASDADAAWAIIDSGTPPIDLLFTDVLMPGALKSIDLARRARAKLPRLAVLFTSGYANPDRFDTPAFERGAALLAKPYTREALGRAVRGALDRPVPPAPSDDGSGAERTTASSDPRPAPMADAPAAARSLAILLVEDDDALRAAAGELIRALGHRVTEAASAEDAMAVLPQRPFDVLMTDIGLPGQPDEVFAALARSIQPEIGIVFATGGGKVSQAFDGTTGPVLLRKPFDAASIAAALTSATR